MYRMLKDFIPEADATNMLKNWHKEQKNTWLLNHPVLIKQWTLQSIGKGYFQVRISQVKNKT